MKKIHRYLLKNAMNLIPEVPKEGNVKLDLKFVDGIELQDVGELMEDEEF